MIGSIIGDIIGSKYEFANIKPGEKIRLFTPDSDFTDDTICTVAIADAYLHGHNYAESLCEWTSRYPAPMGGYGMGFLKWLADPDHKPYESFGNGAAMRISPIGFLAKDATELLAECDKATRCSHNHFEGILGAKVTAEGIRILRTKRKDKFRTFVENMGYEIPQYKPYSNPFNETCMNAVPVAASCLCASKSFEDAIELAMLVGGDSDTIGAIVGGWAEALYGVPERYGIMAMRYLPEDMRNVVVEFYKRLDDGVERRFTDTELVGAFEFNTTK